MKKYILLPQVQTGQINKKILNALEFVPGIIIDDITPISCEISIAEEYVDILRKHLEEIGASLHEPKEAKLIKPVEPPMADLRANAIRRQIKRPVQTKK